MTSSIPSVYLGQPNFDRYITLGSEDIRRVKSKNHVHVHPYYVFKTVDQFQVTTFLVTKKFGDINFVFLKYLAPTHI